MPDEREGANTREITDDILGIGEPALVDESIEAYCYTEYPPQNPATINNNQDISIDVHVQDAYAHPFKSFLHVEGRLASATEVDYTPETQASLVNNGVMYMFSRIRYRLNDQDLENINNLGQATTMKGLLTYGDDFSKAEGLNMCWQKDTSPVAEADNIGWEARRKLVVVKPKPCGTFSFCVPLRHLFGFCEDYRKVVYGCKHSLILSRESDTKGIFRDAAAPKGKVTLTKLAWVMPHVMPSLTAKTALVEQIANKVKVPIAFRALQCESFAVPEASFFTWTLAITSGTEKPRWLLVGFQTNRDNQTSNMACFDHVKVTDIHVRLGKDKYFDSDVKIDFEQRKISRAYKMLRDFKEDYYGIEGIESSNQVTPIEFAELYPIHVLDVRRQSERLKTAVQAVQVNATFSSNVPAGTMAYSVLISDRLLTLESDGTKFSKLY